MRKFGILFFAILAGVVMLSGCTEKPVEGRGEEQSEYALQIGNVQYTVSQKLVGKVPWEDGDVTEVPNDPPAPASRQYQNDQLSISTFLVDDARGSGEQIYSIVTAKEGRTPRNIGIGDSLAALKSAYPELVYHNAAHGNGSELAEYTRLYSYAPEDGTNQYINFYLKDKKVSMIEIADALVEPKNWEQTEPILGQENLFCEVLCDRPGQAHVQYFTLNQDGREELFLDIQNAWPQSLDLDGDGKTEIVVQYSEDNVYTNVGIYHMNEDHLAYFDVAETLEAEGLTVSSVMFKKKAANEQSPYQYDIEVSAKREDGSIQEGRYVLRADKLVGIE
jgi:hypothetical protein